MFVRPSGVKSLVNDKGISELFEGKIEPNDIKQGQLGDCYLLTALACLAEYPERIKKLFVDH
jgi:calpain-15